MLRPELGVQEELRSAHALDGGDLALMRTFHDGDGVPAPDLVRLDVEGHGTVGGLVPFASQFFGTCLAGDAVVVDDGEFLAANADDDSNFVCRTPTAEDNEVV